MAKKSSISKTAVWILMGLLFLGLGGFGAVNLSGNIRTVGYVGDKPIAVDQYARQLQNEIRAVEQQSGQVLTFAQVQQIGLDRAVLQNIVRNRALDHEADQLGISIGDQALRDRVVDIPAFQGLSGDFDREAYAETLRRSGMSEAEFETSLREEAARTLLQGAILSGVSMPDVFTDTMMRYVAQKRSFTWTNLSEEALDPPLAEPTAEDLAKYFEDHADRFVLPATKKITYAMLSPDALIDEVEVEEDLLRDEYEVREATYNQPERRLVERLVFGNDEAADQAAAALEVNGTTFEALVEERGLQLSDIDLGDVGKAELDEAGDAVFAADVGAVVGPLPSSLGPALFRINAVLPAQNTSFEEAREELLAGLAGDRAVRLVERLGEDYDDLLAGGTTLEELADESDMTLGSIDWTAETSEGIAAYADFREAAAALSKEDFPQIAQLDDGSIYAMRLDEELPERPAPFDAVAEEVAQAWRNDMAVVRLTGMAEAITPQLTEGASFADVGLGETIETDQLRSAFVEGTPFGFMDAVFEMAPGEVRMLAGEDSVAIVRLDAINEGDDDPQTQALRAQIAAQQDQTLAQELYDIFATDVVSRAGPEIDARALQAVHVNFP